MLPTINTDTSYVNIRTNRLHHSKNQQKGTKEKRTRVLGQGAGHHIEGLGELADAVLVQSLVLVGERLQPLVQLQLHRACKRLGGEKRVRCGDNSHEVFRAGVATSATNLQLTKQQENHNKEHYTYQRRAADGHPRRAL